MQPIVLQSNTYLDFLETKIKQLEESATRCEYLLLDEDDDANAGPRWSFLQMQREQLLVLKKLQAREMGSSRLTQ